MKKLTFKETLICLSALSIILLWFGRRIFSNKLLIILSPENIIKYNKYFEMVVYFSSFMLAYTFLTILLEYYLENRKPKEGSLFKKIGEKVSTFLHNINIFYHAYSIIFSNTAPEYTQYVIKLAKFTLSLTRIDEYRIILVFIALPRYIILNVLILEIIYGQLHYYFYSLILSLVPLVFKIITFMIKDVGSRSLPEFNKIVELKEQKEQERFFENGRWIVKVESRFVFREEYAYGDLTRFMVDYYEPCAQIEETMKRITYPVIMFVSKVTIILYYIITTISFIYILNWI